jgi:hypothetical protein
VGGAAVGSERDVRSAAVHHRHHPVEEHDVRLESGGCVEPCPSVERGRGRDALDLEVDGGEDADRWLVVDPEHVHRAAHLDSVPRVPAPRRRRSARATRVESR